MKPTYCGFEKWLAQQEGRVLGDSQKKMAKLLLECVTNEAGDADIRRFLIARRTGKTFLFENLCRYMSEVALLP